MVSVALARLFVAVGEDVGAVLLRVASQVLLLLEPLLQLVLGLQPGAAFVVRGALLLLLVHDLFV